jgi:serine carboxypeptidase-like clade II
MLLFTFESKNSGDTDAVLPLTATRYSLKALNLKPVTDWYAWYDNQKVSYV